MSGILVGIDGGGTNTRVCITDVVGNLIHYKKANKPSNWERIGKEKSKENVYNLLKEAIDEAKYTFGDIISLVAGIAGVNENDKLAKEIIDFNELKICSMKKAVNDTDIAYKGAFLSKSGIIVIAGTGSAILGITEKRERVTTLSICRCNQF